MWLVGLIRAERQNPHPCPAVHTALDTDQDTTGFSGELTLPAPVQDFIYPKFSQISPDQT